MSFSLSFAGRVIAISLMLFFACSDSSPSNSGGGSRDGGSIGWDATSGLIDSGTTSALPVILPQCVSSAYQIVFRGFFEPMDPLLRYLDTPVAQRNASQRPPISSLTELNDVPDIYARFTWNANDVPGVVDSGDTLVTADFGFDPTGGNNPALLDNGIGGSEVVQVPWEVTVGGAQVGAGRMSVVGLDDDVVRITIVAFNPWYEGWANHCHLEITSFSLHLDLATPGSAPYAVVIGYEAAGSGFSIDNGSIILGDEETASFTGDFTTPALAEPVPFDLEVDFGEDPATVTGTFSGMPQDCTIDLGSFQVAC